MIKKAASPFPPGLMQFSRFLVKVLLAVMLASCVLPAPKADTERAATLRALAQASSQETPDPKHIKTQASPTRPRPNYTPLPTRDPNLPLFTPTPNRGRILPTLRSDQREYVVQPNDTLAEIAQSYGVDLNVLIKLNRLSNPDLLEVGQVLVIPPPVPAGTGPGFKVIPDSELVFSPPSADFDLEGFIKKEKGYLSKYTEKVDDELLTGATIVDRIAREFSVNPRLLLAVLEYRSKWVTHAKPSTATLVNPIILIDKWHEGLYRQLAWTANNLNRGYYLWQVNAISHWLLRDGSVLIPDASINAGTAGVQHLMSMIYGREDWEISITENGLFHTYVELFGYPFDYTFEPIVPSGLKQPLMQLPFEEGAVWSFTGGPHGGWGDGSGWAALDFAPPGDAFGCVPSDAWITSVADGLIVRSAYGVVVLDLDLDGYEQTGWTVLFLHVATQDRVPAGVVIKAGDRIGHPSCEGGVSSGTHVHIARRYNGEWISADGPLPFNLDGWISAGNGIEYDGFLKRNGITIEAWNRRTQENQIQR